MNKIDLINSYIEKSDLVVNQENSDNAKKLQDEIIGVFGAEIANIESQLDNYNYGTQGAVDFIGDLRLLKAKLINYKSNLEIERKCRIDELEKLRLQQSILTINNNHQLSNNSSSNAISTTTIVVNIDKTIENVYKLPDKVLSKVEKEELEEKLSAIEVAKNSGDKGKIASKIGNVLKYIADKGVDVGIATLPYLGEISKFIGTL